MVDPADLIEAARTLVASGAPSDAALRRSVSTAYYALFHAIAGFAADWLVAPGSTSAAYALIYRGLDHRRMKDTCEEVAKSILKAAVRQALGRSTVSSEMKAFAVIFVPMQQLRHLADYHPAISLSRPDVLDLIDETESGLRDFTAIPRDELADVVTYMLVGSRAA